MYTTVSRGLKIHGCLLCTSPPNITKYAVKALAEQAEQDAVFWAVRRSHRKNEMMVVILCVILQYFIDRMKKIFAW